MDFASKKIEMAFGAAVVIFVGAMGWMFAGGSKGMADRFEDLVYEMPRPKSLVASLFELGDRSISRDYKNPYEKAKKQSQNKADKIETPKAADQKKTIAQKPKNSVKPQALKKKFDVDVVQAANAKAAFSGASDSYAITGAAYSANQNVDKKTDTVNREKLSGSQWRALMQADPSEDNLAKFLTAYSKGEVESSVYFQIVNDLLSNNRTEVQQLGVVALHANYSSQAFMTASQYYDVVDSSLQSKLHSYVQNYATTARLDILASVLSSSDSDSVALATQVVVEGYQAAKSGNALSSDPRSIRGDSVNGPISSYSKFVPIFRSLSSSSDSTVANLASAALSQIQTSVASL